MICLRSPVIDLTTVAAANLTFSQALDIDSSGVASDDIVMVNVIEELTNTIISADIIPTTDGFPLDAVWENIGPIALPVGQKVRIEWCLTAGGTSTDYLGWYIDNVQVLQAAP